MSVSPVPADPLTSGTPTGTPTHPTYDAWAPRWEKLRHAYGGTGGFADGTYLVAHPREWEDHQAENPTKPTKKLKARRKLARYENVAATLIDQKRSAIFRESIVRTVGDPKKTTKHPLEVWWDNVAGTSEPLHISDYMAQSFTLAAIFGHLIHVMDRPAGPQPMTRADEKAPYLRYYAPLDMPDWLTNDKGELTAVKLLEAILRTSLDERPLDATQYQERYITATDFKVVSHGTQSASVPPTPHNFGCLPVVVQYAKRQALVQVIGASVLNDPQLYVDLYNLTSEIRELLRNQTFGWLNVELGVGENQTDVEKAKTMMGTGAGTDNVLFSPGPANFIQPDTANVEVYQKERQDLLRTIYRLCAVPWESDTRDAEAEGSLKLKREDMNQILAAYADECEKAEYGFVKLWFRATYGTSWEQQFNDADVVIRYPETFDVTPFADILEQAQAAITLDMPPVFMKELKRRLVQKFLPDATSDVIDAIDKDLEQWAKDAAKMDSTSARAKLQSLLSGANPDAPFATDGQVAA